jgi:probable F420-dependent oxidoreductase
MSIRAGIGIADFSFKDADEFWHWISLCDNGDVDSIWQSDRIIGAEPTLECMSVMAALAGGTKHIKFGMNVASLGLRDPVITAKACATIDVLSNGRLLPAFGIGTALGKDYSARGVPTKGRGKRTNEGLEIMYRLWTEDKVNFDGEFFQLNEATIAPKPVQKPIPLWIGGVAPAAVERTAKWATGWQAGIETPEQIKPVVDAIKARATELGRHIPEDHYGGGFAFRFGSKTDPVAKTYIDRIERFLGKMPTDLQAIGDEQEMMELLLRYKEAGLCKFVLRPIASGGEDMIRQTELMVEKLLPLVAKLN